MNSASAITTVVGMMLLFLVQPSAGNGPEDYLQNHQQILRKWRVTSENLKLCQAADPHCLEPWAPGCIHGVALVENFVPITNPALMDAGDRMMREYMSVVQQLLCWSCSGHHPGNVFNSLSRL